jgi:lipoprotein-anchoring transpeptidase ErfK/SrfK
VHGSQRRRFAVTALAAAAALLATACQGSMPAATQLNSQAVASRPATLAARDLTITPAPGTPNAGTSGGITVTAAGGGTITAVRARTAAGQKITGSFRDGGRSWHSTYALPTGQACLVTATGTDGAGRTVTATSRFTTLTPATAFHAEIYEGQGATYGVGMPIMVTFDHPIVNKAAVERSLQLTTSVPVVGAWYWDGSEQVDFRPRDYWPASTTVRFDGHLDGVEVAPGVYGVHDLTQTFGIGQSVIAVASAGTHTTEIYIGGALRYTWPISTGKATTPTPDGTYLTVEKGNPVRMIGGGPPGSAGHYDELVNWAVRFTFSGDYYHSAPWSVVDQGITNVSHGCVNLPPADAQAFYDLALPGDPVTIENSPAAGHWDDGWTEWFLSWPQYLAGSATHQAVLAGPGGSSFVRPSAVPADAAATPTGTSAAGNYFAA